MKLFALELAFLAGLSLAEPARALEAPSRIKQVVTPPKGWTRHSSPSRDSRIELRIGLAQPNIHLLEGHLREISDPGHTRYGQHLSKADVEALVAPHEQSIQLVHLWLDSFGVDPHEISRTPGQDWFIVDVPINLAEEMLDTKYHIWKHDDGSYIARTTSYSLPESLYDHIDLIQPTTMFARLSGMRSTMYRTKSRLALGQTQNSTPSTSNCNEEITLDCLRDLYNTTGYEPRACSKNSIGITGYLGQYANEDDLQTFYAKQRPDAANRSASFDVVLINGGQNNQSTQEAGEEANLDVQYAFGLSYPTPGTFYSTGGSPPFRPDEGTPMNTNEPYAKWLDYILAQDDHNVPLTISTSYGDHEQTVPEDYARRTCSRLMELGSRGVTLLFSSGDGGVGDNNPSAQSQICKTNDGRNETRFLPVFPSSCPYVTSVGGTYGIPEKAVFFSGGGFSNYVFARPWYQDRAVKTFLNKLGNTYGSLFNSSGRAYPDVSAQALNFDVIIGGLQYHISGTSASSPTFAGIVALLNDARLDAGLSPLGFLNPMLYTKGLEFHALNDIIVGNNPGCGTEGFNATEGWDPVTGLGTPNFKKLRDIVLNETES